MLLTLEIRRTRGADRPGLVCCPANCHASIRMTTAARAAMGARVTPAARTTTAARLTPQQGAGNASHGHAGSKDDHGSKATPAAAREPGSRRSKDDHGSKGSKRKPGPRRQQGTITAARPRRQQGQQRDQVRVSDSTHLCRR